MEQQKNIPQESKNNLEKAAVLVTADQSSWCTYLEEDAAAEAMLLLHPTVSAEVDYQGHKTIRLGYDLANLRTAGLIKEKAEAKCRNYLARSALNSLIIIAPNQLTRATFDAQAKVIEQRRGALLRFQQQIRDEVKNGVLTIDQAGSLLVEADWIIADGAKASSEAARRQIFNNDNIREISAAGQLLLDAEREIADLNSSLRTAEALSVTVEAGWRDSSSWEEFNTEENSWFLAGKVSAKLGIFNPALQRHEHRALQARLQAQESEPGSVFWRIKELINAFEQSKDGLLASRKQLAAAKNTAETLKKILPENNADYFAQLYKTELEIIKLEAGIAGIDASLTTIEQHLTRLGQISWH
jgi:hypothetical protein